MHMNEDLLKKLGIRIAFGGDGGGDSGGGDYGSGIVSDGWGLNNDEGAEAGLGTLADLAQLGEFFSQALTGQPLSQHIHSYLTAPPAPTFGLYGTTPMASQITGLSTPNGTGSFSPGSFSPGSFR